MTRFKGLLIAAMLSLASIVQAQGGTIGGGGGGTTGWTFGLGTITGAASSATIQCGTGNSRTCTFQTTTSAGVTKNTLVLGADTSATFLGQIKTRDGTAALPMYRFTNTSDTVGLYRFGLDTLGFSTKGVSSLSLSGGANPVLSATTGNFDFAVAASKFLSFDVAGSSVFDVQANSVEFNQKVKFSDGTAALPGVTFQSDSAIGLYRIGTAGAGDTIMIAANGVNQMKIAPAGILRLPLLPAEGSTKNAICWDGSTFNVTQNAAATCTVSSARFKQDIRVFPVADAQRIVSKLHASSYSERQGGRLAIGIIAEQADTADWRLASRDAKGLVTSTNYEEVTSVLLMVVKDQQRQLDSIKNAARPNRAGFDGIESLFALAAVVSIVGLGTLSRRRVA